MEGLAVGHSQHGHILGVTKTAPNVDGVRSQAIMIARKDDDWKAGVAEESSGFVDQPQGKTIVLEYVASEYQEIGPTSGGQH